MTFLRLFIQSNRESVDSSSPAESPSTASFWLEQLGFSGLRCFVSLQNDASSTFVKKANILLYYFFRTGDIDLAVIPQLRHVRLPALFLYMVTLNLSFRVFLIFFLFILAI